MITPDELLAKAGKMFFKIASASLKGEQNFPLVIPSNKGIAGSNFSDWKNDLVPLFQQSKEVKKKGYKVDWTNRMINGSKQTVPAKIYFETIEDFLHFAGRQTDYNKIRAARDLLADEFAALAEWANGNPSVLLDYASVWNDIVKVCRFFENHNPPHQYYIRELPVEVHSKFIEQHSSLLKKLLDIILPEQKKNPGSWDFAERYFCRKIDVYTQIRILDDDLRPHLGYDECILKLEDAAWLKWLPDNVFIIENQVCFLTFPKVKNSVAIFGEGFKSRVSKDIPWLKKTRLFCWFDMDTAGFEMLNMIREHYPRAESLLMNRETYDAFESFSVNNNTKRKALPLLNEQEQNFYGFLIAQSKRLEQERISQPFIEENINALKQDKKDLPR